MTDRAADDHGRATAEIDGAAVERPPPMRAAVEAGVSADDRVRRVAGLQRPRNEGHHAMLAISGERPPGDRIPGPEPVARAAPEVALAREQHPHRAGRRSAVRGLVHGQQHRAVRGDPRLAGEGEVAPPVGGGLGGGDRKLPALDDERADRLSEVGRLGEVGRVLLVGDGQPAAPADGHARGVADPVRRGGLRRGDDLEPAA